MDYIPYGEEWIKEMSKLPKDAILRMFQKMGIEKNQEYQQLKKSKSGDRDCEELKKEVDILEKFNKRQFDTISELQEEIKRIKEDNKRDPWDDLGRNLSETTF
jgi:predicted RNase H-like nuclease (RuvC/YqgF family)